jgi:hypothetical protein
MLHADLDVDADHCYLRIHIEDLDGARMELAGTSWQTAGRCGPGDGGASVVDIEERRESKGRLRDLGADCGRAS